MSRWAGLWPACCGSCVHPARRTSTTSAPSRLHKARSGKIRSPPVRNLSLTPPHLRFIFLLRMTTLTQDPAGRYTLLIRYTCVIEGLRRIRDAHGAGPLAPLICYLITRMFVLLVRHAERLRPAQPADPAPAPARGDRARTPPRIRSTVRSRVGTVAAADRLIAALGTRDPEVAPPTTLAIAAVAERRFTAAGPLPARPLHTRNGARPHCRGSGLFAKHGIAAAESSRAKFVTTSQQYSPPWPPPIAMSAK